jgi:hypothetical protein
VDEPSEFAKALAVKARRAANDDEAAAVIDRHRQVAGRQLAEWVQAKPRNASPDRGHASRQARRSFIARADMIAACLEELNQLSGRQRDAVDALVRSALRGRPMIRKQDRNVPMPTGEVTRQEFRSSVSLRGPWLKAMLDALKCFPEYRQYVRQCPLPSCGAWYIGRRRGCSKSHQNRLTR